MITALGLVYLALPLIVTTAYAYLWPTVSARVGLFIALGSVFGLLIAASTLFWVVQPLIGGGIRASSLIR